MPAPNLTYGTPAIVPSTSGLPLFLHDLLHTLSNRLQQLLPSKTHALLFPPPDAPPRARQVIVNFYRPGEGITPHVDLLDRFDDGIIGVSLGSGCVMRFCRSASSFFASNASPAAVGPDLWGLGIRGMGGGLGGSFCFVWTSAMLA